MLFQQYFVVLYRPKNILGITPVKTHPIKKFCLAAYVTYAKQWSSKNACIERHRHFGIDYLRKPKRSISERYASASLRFK